MGFVEISIKKRGKKDKRKERERTKTLGNCSFRNSVEISIKKRGKKRKEKK